MQDEFAKAAAEYCQPEKEDIPQLRQPFCDSGSIKTVNLQKSVDDKFEKLAAQHNVPAESLLRDAVRQHLGRKAAKPTRQASA